MVSIEINLRKPCGWKYREIRELLLELSKLEGAQAGDKITVILPEKNQVSEAALAIMWTRLNEFKKFPGDKLLLYSKSSAHYFDERHFFDNLLGKKTGFWSSKIPFHFSTFNLGENEEDTASKVATASQSSIATMPLGQEIKVHILELVSNAFHHSRAEIDVGCISRFDPESGIFDFSIVDQGCGVRKSFSRNKPIWPKYEGMTHSELLEKATEKSITCNPAEAPQYQHNNSGIGLYFLREFCIHHKGYLVIVSGKGYFYTDGYKTKRHELPLPWDGTIVSFRASLADGENSDYATIKGEYVSESINSPFVFG